MRQPAYLVALALIGVVALALRLWGIGFGLPQLYHPDEPAYVLQALAVGRGLPDGLTFANPPLFKYLLLAEYAATFLVERALGRAQSAAAFVEQFRADPSQLYLIARITSAVLGALTALATALLGASIGSRRVGLLAGSLAAVTYLLVRDAHFGTDDMLVTLLVTLGLAACVGIITRGRRRDYVMAGALVGLAFAAKYDGLALLVPLLLAHVARPCRRMTNLGLGLVATALAAIVAFPSLLTEPQRVISDVYTHLYLEAANGYDGLDPSGGYVFYARTLVIALGWPLLVAAVGGAVLSVARRHWPSVIVLSLPVTMLAALGSQQLYFARFALPVLPALVVQASLALDALRARQVVVGAVAIAVAAAVTLVDAVRFDGLITQTDTRTLAAQWLSTEALYAADAPPLGPPLPPQRNLATDGAALYDTSLDAYRGRGVEYLIVSSFTADARAVDPAREAKRLAFNAALGNEQLVATFSPGDVSFVYDQTYGPYTDLGRLERPGPKISVYRLTR